MTQTATTQKSTNGSQPVVTLDAAVIGAGVAGLYQLYLLRKQRLQVKAFDAAPDAGGTWYWNRYPGARFDSESYIYQYLFSEELYKGWSWSEKFPGQPEVERWMHYVADKLDLRRDIQFSTTMTGTVGSHSTCTLPPKVSAVAKSSSTRDCSPAGWGISSVALASIPAKSARSASRHNHPTAGFRITEPAPSVLGRSGT